MDAFYRLSELSSTVRERASPIWKWAVGKFGRGLRWLRRRRRPVLVIIVGGLLLYLGLPYAPQVWSAYKADRDSFTPFFTPIAALLAGLAAKSAWAVDCARPNVVYRLCSLLPDPVDPEEAQILIGLTDQHLSHG